MIDLHTHTKYSDGTDTLIEYLKKVNEANLDIISITDHDNCNAYKELQTINISDYYKGRVIPGIELKTHINGFTIEILGYGIDTKKVNETISNLYIPREQRKKMEYEKLYKKCIKAGIKFIGDINKNYNEEEYEYGTAYIHSEIQKIETNKAIITDEKAWKDPNIFYRRYMSDPKSLLYIDVTDIIPSAKKNCEYIKEMGGLVFIPHIYIYGTNSDRIFKELLEECPIDGFECYYSTFTEEQTKFLVNFCKENNLYISGGSDYHGRFKPDISLGVGKGNLNIPNEIIYNWIDKVI